VVMIPLSEGEETATAAHVRRNMRTAFLILLRIR
jgi:hypothetical protein